MGVAIGFALLAYLLTGWPFFGDCANDWPPPVFGLALIIALLYAVTRCLTAIIVGGLFAACVRWRVPAWHVLLAGALIPVIVEIAFAWPTVQRAARSTGSSIDFGLLWELA